MFTKLLQMFRYHGDIPMSILVRASTLATLTGCYIAFNQDGTCYIYPVQPILLKDSGKWIPRGRCGAFQCEEIKFTLVKYQYSNWDTLISPVEGYKFPFTYEKMKLTRKLKKNQKL